MFWERLELFNFPVDIQELSVILASRLGPHEVKLVPEPDRLSFMNLNALNTFIDQQKWYDSFYIVISYSNLIKFIFSLKLLSLFVFCF